MRDSAVALASQGKMQLAKPLLEQLAARDSTDATVQKWLGFVLLTDSQVLPDSAARRMQRMRARSALGRSLRLGLRDSQVSAVFAAIPENGGSDTQHSSNAEIDGIMRNAETAYAGGDYRKAFLLYQKALVLDPKLYTAALYSGDTYVHSQTVDSAYIWYDRATKIDPHRETAWRYWSDILLKQGKFDEAGDKAIRALIAEPYSRFSRSALAEWAGKTKTVVSFPLISMPEGTAEKPATPARAAYDSVRLLFKGRDGKATALFKSTFPNESEYRHSVHEERMALRAAYARDTTYAGTQMIKRMDDANMLEAFILIAVADEGIAAEYEAYRRDFQDVLEQFLKTFVMKAQESK